MASVRRYITSSRLASAAALALALGASSLGSSSAYLVQDLGTLGGTFSWALAINGAGEVTGYSTIAGDEAYHAFRFHHGALEDLAPLPGQPLAQGLAIAPDGRVAGFSGRLGFGDVPAMFRAVISDRAGVFSDLGVLPGFADSYAFGVNPRGQVVGRSCTGVFVTLCRAVRFHPAGGPPDDLGTLGGANSSASAIDPRGRIVGDANTAKGRDHAFLLDDRGMHDLGTLGGPDSFALAINNDNVVVGFAHPPGGMDFHAFRMRGASRPGAVMEDLGTLPGDTDSFADAVNDCGEVVGTSNTSSFTGGTVRPFIFADGRMRDLNELIPADSGWTLDFASAINDAGQIAGMGRIGGQRHAFLLTPEPELSSCDD